MPKGVLKFVKKYFPNRANAESEETLKDVIKPVNHGHWENMSTIEKKVLFSLPFVLNQLKKNNYDISTVEC